MEAGERLGRPGTTGRLVPAHGIPDRRRPLDPPDRGRLRRADLRDRAGQRLSQWLLWRRPELWGTGALDQRSRVRDRPRFTRPDHHADLFARQSGAPAAGRGPGAAGRWLEHLDARIPPHLAAWRAQTKPGDLASARSPGQYNELRAVSYRAAASSARPGRPLPERVRSKRHGAAPDHE